MIFRTGDVPRAAFDLVRFASAAGHLNNVATVLGELAEKIEPAALVKLADAAAVAEVQRLGFLLDLVGAGERAEPLAAWLKARRCRPVLLAPLRAKGRAAVDRRWRVIPNVRIEVDQ